MLRRKNDWDVALEESRVKESESPKFVPGPDYDYGQTYTFTLADLAGDQSEPRAVQ